jgi:hypothetical protein
MQHSKRVKTSAQEHQQLSLLSHGTHMDKSMMMMMTKCGAIVHTARQAGDAAVADDRGGRDGHQDIHPYHHQYHPHPYHPHPYQESYASLSALKHDETSAYLRPAAICRLSEEAKWAIGRAGEAYVFEMLQKEYGELHQSSSKEKSSFPSSSSSLSTSVVEWMNQDAETGLPYDICIHHASGGREYIEVKSTSTVDKMTFEMSVQELDYASQQGSMYSIYRVFQVRPDVGDMRSFIQGAPCRIVKLRNPITLLRQKKLKLSVLMDDDSHSSW